MSSAESRVSCPTVGGRFPKPIQSISCSQLGCSWVFPVTDDTSGRYSSPYRYTRVDVGKQSHPFCIAAWESNAFLGTGRGRVCEKRKLSFWADSGLEREEHVCRHTNFQAQTSEKKKKNPSKSHPPGWVLVFLVKQHATHVRPQVSPLQAAQALCAQTAGPGGGHGWLIPAWAEGFPHTSLCGICFMLQLGTSPHVEIQVEACSDHRICKACLFNQS